MTELSSGRTWRDRWEIIESRIPKEPGIALDIGASTGLFAFELAQLGWTVYAVDPDTNLDHEEGVRGEHPNIRWFNTTLDSRTIATFPYRVHVERFDLVLGLSVLHWMDDWAAAYWAMRRIGDTVIIEVPHPLEHRGDPVKALRFQWLEHLAVSDGDVYASALGWESDLHRTMVVADYDSLPWVPTGFEAIVHTGNGYGVDLIPQIPNIADALGYEPFPGTIDHHLLDRFVKLDPAPIKLGTPEECWSFWPVDYMGLPAHVCGHPGWDAEGPWIDLVGPVPFREVFGLRDGDVAWIEGLP